MQPRLPLTLRSLRRLAPVSLLMPLGLTFACGGQETPTEPASAAAAVQSGITPASTASVAVDNESVFWTSLAVGSGGRKHIAYPLFDPIGDGGVKYATCLSDCTVAANWRNVLLDAGSRAAIEVGPGGRRHLVYGGNGGTLKYATCITPNCVAAADWQKVIADPGRPGGGVGLFPSIALGPNGTLHVSHESADGIKYSVCSSDCTSAPSWTNVVIDEALFMRGPTTIALGPDGRLHISYLRHAYPDGNFAFDLRYATCLADCTDPANWRKVTVERRGRVGLWSSLALGPGGRVHISYLDGGNTALKYATCLAQCGVATSWHKVTVDNAGGVGLYTSIAVSPSDGRVHISHFDIGHRDLEYATCAASCTSAASWQRLTLDQTGQVGEFTSLALDGGKVDISYFDRAGFVKYLEHSP